ncbi:MAG: hypothetical protein LBJ67_18525 [Planctomycetaceae bacterium]|jgi:uncharacterized protein involved in exopolysaccharide biosynthesis/Mrp family chromosome partitioning ATPase|nr:hypothetical protein [Planctomycetaceae bacterium]
MSENNHTQKTEQAAPEHKAVFRNPEQLPASANEIINRAFREPYFRFLLFTTSFWRHWYWIVPSSIVVATMLAAVVFFAIPGKYTASVWIQVYFQRPYIVYAPQGMSQQEVSAAIQAQLQLFHSPMVLNRAFGRIVDEAGKRNINIEELLKKEEPTAWLSNHLEISQRGASSMYIVSYATPDKQLSKLYIDAMIDSYFEYSENQKRAETEAVSTSLKNTIAQIKQEISNQEEEYNRLTQQLIERGGTPPTDSQLLLAQEGGTASVRLDVARLKASIAEMKQKIEQNQEVLKMDDPEKIPDSAVEFDVFTNDGIRELLLEKVTLKKEYETLKKRYSEDAPNIHIIRKKMDENEKSISELIPQLKEDAKKMWLAARMREAHVQILLLKDSIESSEIRMKQLDDDQKKFYKSKGNDIETYNSAVDIAKQKRLNETVYEMLISRLHIIDTERAARDQVEKLSETNEESQPNFADRNRLMALVALFGLAIPVVWAWKLEMSSARFYHLSQFRIMFPQVSLETIGGMPRPGLAASFTGKQRRIFQQSIEELCHNFLEGRYFNKAKIFLFSSVQKDDGQTLAAINIAEKMAQIKKQPILLIDTFAENPRLRKLMGVEGKGSLSDVLATRLGMNEAITRDSQQPFLYFLPDGQPAADNSVDIFNDGNFDLLLKELSKHYAAIIISAPPFQVSSAAYSLSSHVDAIVVTLRIYDTLRKNTEDVFERLDTLGTPVTAFAVAGISENRFVV